MWILDEIPKALNLNGCTYYIGGTIIFIIYLRTGSKVTNGHFKAFTCRLINYWKVFSLR